tara:strand:+ start:239 stop:772 length:534 start_codon:yes stop_codon:yes gene_type:complete
MRLKLIGILIIPILFLFPTAYSFQLLDKDDFFEVLPGKEYSGEICIRNINFGDQYSYTYDLNYSIFENIIIKENIIINTTKNEFCNPYSFIIKDYKNKQTENFEQRIYVKSEGNIDKNYSGNLIKIRYPKTIYIDASMISYKDLLFNFSKRFFLVAFSIYAVFSLLLYIINSKKFNE